VNTRSPSAFPFSEGLSLSWISKNKPLPFQITSVFFPNNLEQEGVIIV
jgi:hypothetical protein